MCWIGYLTKRAQKASRNKYNEQVGDGCVYLALRRKAVVKAKKRVAERRGFDLSIMRTLFILCLFE